MKLNKWLNIAGVLNIIVGILMFIASNLSFIPVIFLIVSGFYYQNYFNKEGPLKRKSSLITLGIINLIFNFISGIIVLEVSGLIKKEDNYTINSEINKKNRINGLLQLGVVLVLLSGIMIATNQTLIIPNIFKVVGLLLLSGIFFFLSYVGKKYLKLESSFKTYFLLGMSFIIISFIGLYYYNLLGSISYNRFYYLYFYPALFLLISICSIISEKYIKNEKFKYSTVISLFATLYLWFNAVGFTPIQNLLLMTIIVSMINFIYSPSTKLIKITTRVSNVLSYILVPINILLLINNSFDIYSFILATITTLNIFHLLVYKKDNFTACLFNPTLILMSSIILGMSDTTIEIKLVFFQTMMISFYYLIKLINLESINSLFRKINRVSFNIALITTAITTLFINTEASLIVTSLLLLQNITGIFENRHEELMLEPLKTLLFSISLILFINDKVNLDIIFNLFIIEIIELLLYLIIKIKILKKIHYILYLIFIGLISIISTETSEIYLALIALISATLPFIISYFKKENSLPIVIFTFIALLLTNSNAIFSEIYYLNYLVTFILMIAYAYYYKNYKDKKYISLFSSSLLALSFVNTVAINYDLYSCMNLLIYSYIGAIIYTTINKKEIKDIFMTIYFTILCLLYIFISSSWVFITVTLVTIILVTIAFIKDFKKLKITAIILFIINLIYQLKDIWKDIPVAIYLLIIGLALIGIVIVKEIKDNKE